MPLSRALMQKLHYKGDAQLGGRRRQVQTRKKSPSDRSPAFSGQRLPHAIGIEPCQIGLSAAASAIDWGQSRRCARPLCRDRAVLSGHGYYSAARRQLDRRNTKRRHSHSLGRECRRALGAGGRGDGRDHAPAAADRASVFRHRGSAGDRCAGPKAALDRRP